MRCKELSLHLEKLATNVPSLPTKQALPKHMFLAVAGRVVFVT